MSELDAWRYLTPDDPFDELVYMWLNDLGWFSIVGAATFALCERIVRTQLKPAFGDLTMRRRGVSATWAPTGNWFEDA